MAEQSQHQDGEQGEVQTVVPERQAPESYATAQILEAMPSLVARAVIYLSLLVLAVGIVYAGLTQLDVVVRCPAVIQPGQVSRLTASRGSVVDRVLVGPGQHVRKGEPLLLLRPPEGEGSAEAWPLEADVDGMVMELPAGDRGAAVGRGDVLCTLHPDAAGLKASMKLSNRDVGRVEAGMPLSLRLDAYPVADFGVVRARVGAVGPIAREDPQLGYVYPVSAELSQGWVEAHGKRFQLRPGMTATAEIVVGQKSMLTTLVGGLGD
jgi:multidrug efflux pump subunit AcrA (membrane-fusion protein)